MADIYFRGDISQKDQDQRIDRSHQGFADFDLLSFLNHADNSVSGTPEYDGRYTQISYSLCCLHDQDLWRLRIRKEMIQTTTSLNVSCDALVLDFSVMEPKDLMVKRINVRGLDCDISSQSIFRAFMAASVIIAKVDAGQCPDVLKILRTYGFRKKISGL